VRLPVHDPIEKSTEKLFPCCHSNVSEEQPSTLHAHENLRFILRSSRMQRQAEIDFEVRA